MTNFDEFLNAFIYATLEWMDLIYIDMKIFDMMLEAPIKGIDKNELGFRLWLAQKKFYYGWRK